MRSHLGERIFRVGPAGDLIAYAVLDVALVAVRRQVEPLAHLAQV